jgi:hypothetical protein
LFAGRSATHVKSVILNGAADGDQRSRDAAGILTDLLGPGSVQEFRLCGMELSPCRSCGSCGLKTPGVCVVKDDLPLILHSMAGSPLLVLLTPVRFGGYSKDLKKAIDRLMPMGLPLYFVRDGHLLHPTRYENPRRLLGIGVLDDMDEYRASCEDAAFRLHVKSNSLNMLMDKYSVVVLPPSAGAEDITVAIGAAIEEVLA